MTLTIGSLCSGYGGLDLAVEQQFGAETRWFCEFEEAPSRVLEAHWPGVPNHGDMTKVDWASVEPVDIICGGTPCQDLSAAGARKGMTEGTRSNLWVQMREAIAIIRPRIVIWENVRGALSAYATSEMESKPGLLGESYGPDRPALRALGRVLGDLSDLGFDAEWVGVRASDAGAPHGRFRVFVVAVRRDADADREGLGGVGRLVAVGRDADRCGGADGARNGTEPEASANAASVQGCVGDGDDVRARRGTVGREPSAGRGALADAGGEAVGLGAGLRASKSTRLGRGRPADDAVEAASDAAGIRLGEDEPSVRSRESDPSRGHGDPAPDARGARLGEHPGADRGSRPAVGWGPYRPAIERWEHVLGRVAPAPTNPDGKGSAHRLAPEFVEWMMGAPEGWVTGVPGISRNAMLKMLGNGVVTQQALLAISVAWERLGDVIDALSLVCVTGTNVHLLAPCGHCSRCGRPPLSIVADLGDLCAGHPA